MESEWIPFLTTLVGIAVGAMLSEVHASLASSRERRQALNTLLFELLRLRADIALANPKFIVDALYRYIRRKFGTAGAEALDELHIHEAIGGSLRQFSDGSRLKVVERYQTAVQSVVRHEPLLAYRLSGNERIAHLERAVKSYYSSIANQPVVDSDPNSTIPLAALEDVTLGALICEVKKELARDARIVARACGTDLEMDLDSDWGLASLQAPRWGAARGSR